jgi:uncharacterized delta-60 repeat protein
MIQFDLFFTRGRRGSWLAACLCWLLSSAALAQVPVAPPFMVRATPTGSVGLNVGQEQLLTATAVYPAFISAGFDGPVYATAVQADGKILVGGSFSTYNNVSCQYLARLNVDGTLDASFTMGTDLDNMVYAIAVQGNGDILIGGAFTKFKGTVRGGLARLSPAGALDALFAPSSFNGGPVRAIATQPNNSVLVGGEFTSYGPTTNPALNSAYVVRLDNTGTLDSNFATNTHNAATSINVNAAVLALLPSSSGDILVGGRFSAGRRGIARLTSAGMLDTNFGPVVNIPAGIEIAAIAEDGPRVWVGGSYSSSGTTTAAYLNLLDNVGQPVYSFSSGFATGTTGTSVRVNSLTVLPATNQLLVGGEFTHYDNQAHSNLFALDAAGTPASNFSVGVGFDAPVRSLALAPGGNVVVGGDFTTYKDLAAKRITRLKPTGQADDIDVPVPGVATTAYTWYTVAGPVSNGNTATLLTSDAGTYWVTATITLNGVTSTSPISNTVTLTVAAPTLAPIAVHVTPPGSLSLPAAGQSQQLKAEAVYPALRVGTGFSRGSVNYRNIFSFKTQPNGKLVVGGNFIDYNGTPCQYIVRLHADGTLDPTFRYAASGGIDNIITLVALQPNGKIVVGGDFKHYSTKTLNNLARLNTDGTLDLTFKGSFNVSPMDITFLPNGKMLVVGNFDTYYTTSNSSSTPAPFVVRLTADGEFDTDFTPKGVATLGTGKPGLDGAVNALALQPDGKVLVGGDFLNYGITPRQRIARLNADGSLDPSFDPSGAGLTARVHSLALQPDGKVLVGGEFGGHLIRLNANGSLDTSFTPPSFAPPSAGSTIVATLVLQSDGRILVGGQFQGSIRHLLQDGTPDPTFSLTGPGFNAKVSTLAIQPDGHLLAGGEFTNYGPLATTPNRNGLARLNPDGSLNNTDQTVPGTATYAWSNGSTGPTLTVAASGTYSATATFLAQTGISNDVTVVVGGAPPAPFTVRITPTGPLSLCATGPGSSQTLTAQVMGAPAGTAVTYTWWQVSSGGSPPTPLSTSLTAPYSYQVSASAPGQYYATATIASGPLAGTGASPSVSVGQAPLPNLTTPLTTPVIGLPGTNVVLKGTNMEQVTEVRFGNATTPLTATFAVSPQTQNAPAELTIAVPMTAVPGNISVLTACSAGPITLTNGFTFPAPTISSNPSGALAGAPGSTVVVEGTNFVAGNTSILFPTYSTAAISATVTSDTQLTFVVPLGMPSSSYSLVVSTGGGSSNPAIFTALGKSISPLVITPASPPLVAGNTYDYVLIQAPTVVTLSGSATSNVGITVNRLEVQDGATLNLTGNTVVASNGSGSSFLLATGATLNVGHPNGLGGNPAAPGAIQLDRMLFSPDASYIYSGSQPQVTGTNLPSQVRELTSTNSSRLTLSQPLRVAQMLTMAGAGHFYLDTKPLTLLSSAAGTALVVNKGKGRVLGTATVQRYINPAANTGTGFRYYGSPVKGAMAAMLAAPAFDYDQSRYRLTAQKDTLSPFSYGFTTSSLVPNTPLEVGHGYRASVPAATTVNFTGTLTTGDTTITLLRKGKAAYNGWNLVSNPYPAPLNWSSLVAAGGTKGLDAAIYVYESASSSIGDYRSYVNRVSNDGLINQTYNGDLLIAMGQAFFVRVSKDDTVGTITFRNDYRETSYGQQASFNRPTLTRPFDVSIALERNGHGGNPLLNPTTPPQVNRTTLYVDAAGASSPNTPFNPELDADASNLFSFSQQTLSIQGGSSAADGTLAIRAIAPPPASQRTPIPLAVTATEEGNYTMSVYVEGLSQLTPGLVPYLHDKNSSAPTPTLQDLSATTPTAPLQYILYISAAEILSGTLFNRFEIVFQGSALATTPASAALGSAVVFPNPAQRRIHVEVPAVPGATQVQATLFNTLGQPVLRQDAPLPATGTALNLAAERLAGGVYILRLQAGSSIVTRRVLLDN